MKHLTKRETDVVFGCEHFNLDNIASPNLEALCHATSDFGEQ